MEKRYNLLFLLILTVALTLAVSSLKQIRFFGSADEGYYFGYANEICSKGLQAYSAFFKGYAADPRSWVMPNPFRAGFICLSASWFKIFGSSFLNLSLLSLVFYALFLIAAYYFSSKYYGQKFSLLLSVLLAFSPLNMAMARRCLTETAVNLFSLLSIFLFWEYISQGRKRSKLLAFLAVYTMAILVKETSVLLGIIFLLYLAMHKFYYRSKVYLKDVLVCSVIPYLISAFLLLLLGAGPYLFKIARIILVSPGANKYAILFGQGPWFRYLIDYMLLSPWILVLGLGFIFSRPSSDNNQKFETYYIFIFVFILAMFDLFTKNIRYVIMLDFPLRLFSLLLLDRFFRRFFLKNSFAALALVVIFIAVFDYLNFYNFFITCNIYDPVSTLLLGADKIIPVT